MVVANLLTPTNKVTKIAFTLYLLLILIISLCSAPQRTFANELKEEFIQQKAKSLKCTFERHTMAKYESTNIDVIVYDEEITLYIDDIDLDNNTAKFIGNLGTEDVFMLITSTGIHFIEKTDLGNLTFLTIFFNFEEHESQNKLYPAIQSRHLHTVISSPMPAQWYGFCQKWGN